MLNKNREQIKIKIYNLVLNYLHTHDWSNYNGFAVDFTDELLEQFEKNNFDLHAILKKTKGSFLKLNHIKEDQYLNPEFKSLVIKTWNKGLRYEVPVCRITDFFPETAGYSDISALGVVGRINVEESVIQDQLRYAFREKGATPIARRGKDSPLEIADLEHFHLTVNNKDFTFSAVVKGYNSLPGKINLEGVAHQIWKAYITHPDYILLISAREPVDGLVTQLKQYSDSIGNPNLIIFVPPLDLAKFLLWRRIL